MLAALDAPVDAVEDGGVAALEAEVANVENGRSGHGGGFSGRGARGQAKVCLPLPSGALGWSRTTSI